MSVQDGIRTDQYIVTASCDGVPLGVFDKLSGFDVDSKEVKYRRGGGGPEKARGGSITVTDGTLQRDYDPDRDDPIIDFLMSRVGKGDVVVGQQPVDADWNPKGKPRVYTGKVKTCKTPDVDSEGSAAALWDFVISADGKIS